jgi:predicted GNAT superfamily acetyltransferase
MATVDIELVEDPASCRAAEHIQREAWGMADRGVVPAEQMRAVAHNGGMLLLARLDGDPVGFCFGFVGLDGDDVILCSHMLAVLPSAQSLGIGRALKRAQHRHAARRGFTAITWTFDPLQARNAYLNLHHLGAHARTYHVDHYGPMDDEINAGMPTDRLLAEWPVATDPLPRRHLDDAPWLLPPATAAGPGELDRSVLDGDAVRVAVPRDVTALRAAHPEAPGTWCLAVRAALQAAFAAGLVAVDLQRDVAEDTSAYLLERPLPEPSP